MAKRAAKSSRRDLPGRILVVDDEAVNVEVFSRLMSRLGYEVLTALGGRYHRIYRDAAGTNHPA